MSFLTSPFAYHTSFRLKPGHALEADPTHVRHIASAHKNSNKAYPIQAYVSWLGPAASLHFFTPLSSRGEMDTLPRQQEFVDAEHLKNFGQSVAFLSNELLTRSDNHSTLENKSARVNLIYHTALGIAPEYALPGDPSQLNKYVDAHRGSDKGHKFATYYSWLGPAPTLHFFTPLSSYGEMEKISRIQEVVSGDLLREFGAAFNSFTNSLLVYEPSLSS